MMYTKENFKSHPAYADALAHAQGRAESTQKIHLIFCDGDSIYVRDFQDEWPRGRRFASFVCAVIYPTYNKE